MSKQEFLKGLREGLQGLPKNDIDERLDFYSEMIDDRMEEGVSEEEAVEEIGDVDAIVAQIIADVPLGKLVKEKITPTKKLKAWEVVLLALGSPIWLSLLVAVIAVGFSLYICLWSLILVAWSVFVALIGVVLDLAISVFLCSGLAIVGVIGAVLACAGFSIFALYGCLAVTKGTYGCSKQLVTKVKKRFIKRRECNA